jgi:hypothetical protein
MIAIPVTEEKSRSEYFKSVGTEHGMGEKFEKTFVKC